MPRPHFSAFLAMSLDGFIARPDGGLDWLEPMHAGGHEYGYRVFFDRVDTVVIGRRTYDVVLGFSEWPYVGKRVVVLTHSAPASRHGETFFSGTATALAASVTFGDARCVYVDGGAVVSQFIASGLLDELTVSIVPVLLGAGIRLFQGAEQEHPLALVRSEAFVTGLVQLKYRLEAIAVA